MKLSWHTKEVDAPAELRAKSYDSQLGDRQRRPTHRCA